MLIAIQVSFVILISSVTAVLFGVRLLKLGLLTVLLLHGFSVSFMYSEILADLKSASNHHPPCLLALVSSAVVRVALLGPAARGWMIVTFVLFSKWPGFAKTPAICSSVYFKVVSSLATRLALR